MEAYLRTLLEEAIQHHVSDIHLTIKHNELRISMRDAGGMREHSVSGDLRFMAYLRYLSRMNLSNGMIPQTGQLQIMIGNQLLALRFSYLPALDMETGVLRILNQSLSLDLAKLSFLPSQLVSFKHMLGRMHGLILLSGPTGSGKTTTLYAMLDYLKNQLRRNIITLEDPIEVKKEGMIQLQMNEHQLTYEEGLKQVLRHDPDVIMVGEIRDVNTAKMVIRCALTGHLVLSTIHARDCEGVLARMQELGVNKTDLMQTLVGITTQRIFKQKGKRGKICIYEIMDEGQLLHLHQTGAANHNRLDAILVQAVEKGLIAKREAGKESGVYPG